MLDFRDVQRTNVRLTWALLAAFVLLLFVVGAGVDVYLALQGARYGFPFAGVAGLAFGLGAAAITYYGGGRMVLASTGAREITAPKDMEERQLVNVVEEMAVAAGLPRPSVWVIDDPDPNAFAAGRSPETAAVAATRGLLERLDRRELQGVVAHEMAHIRHYDVRLMTLVAALGGSVVLLADVVGRGIFRSGGGRRGGQGGRGGGGALLVVLLVVWVVFLVIAPVVVRLLSLAVSRRREYLADATAAELTRDPGALADALEKIEAAVEPTRSVKQGVAHLCIADPLGRAVNEKEGAWADLWATHPPMRKRIAALRAMAGEPVGA